MKIIILGAGQVGATLADNLASEQNDVTVIDTDPGLLEDLQERLDIRTVQGHASYPNVLRRAGADDADMIIAVTDSDEINMIAMTYNPSYDFTRALAFSNTMEEVLKRRLVIHPEDQSAFFINNYAEGFSNIQTFSNFLTFVAIGVGVLILIAGIVGIGNILIFIILIGKRTSIPVCT